MIKPTAELLKLPFPYASSTVRAAHEPYPSCACLITPFAYARGCRSGPAGCDVSFAVTIRHCKRRLPSTHVVESRPHSRPLPPPAAAPARGETGNRFDIRRPILCPHRYHSLRLARLSLAAAIELPRACIPASDACRAAGRQNLAWRRLGCLQMRWRRLTRFGAASRHDDAEGAAVHGRVDPSSLMERYSRSYAAFVDELRAPHSQDLIDPSGELKPRSSHEQERPVSLISPSHRPAFLPPQPQIIGVAVFQGRAKQPSALHEFS